MSVRAHVDVEEIETTRSEKLLAIVLAIFLLIGGLWTYHKIDDWLRPPADDRSVALSATEEAAIARFQSAQMRLAEAQAAEAQTRAELEIRREAYRTALDAGRADPVLEQAYEDATAAFATAQAARADAERAVEAARPEAEAAIEKQARVIAEREDRRALLTALFRLLFVLATIASGYWLVSRLRSRRSRYLPAGLAFVASAAVLALVMAGDYVTDYVDPLALGPLVLALFGIAATLIAFAALQRYLARRLPVRRVRKHECPFCGYPVGANEHCEGCGRAVIAACARCERPRRVGTVHCGACGQA